jgi:hypothetical protein
MGEPTLAAFVIATSLWLVVAFVPGSLVVAVVDPWRPGLDRLAIAPLVSFGIGFPFSAWAGAIGVTGSVWWAPAALAVASIASGAVLLLRRRRRGAAGRADPETRTTLVATSGAVLAALVVWVVAISRSTPGWGAVVPNIDGGTHGIVVADLIRTGSMFSPSVGRYDLLAGSVDVQTGPFGLGSLPYPYAVHLLAAPIAAMTSVPSALLVPLTVLASVWLVLGTVVLTRRFTGRTEALVAGYAAALLVPSFPYWHVFWGPVPMMAALALVPALTIALLDTTPRRGLVVPVLALAGMIAIHVTEALVATAIVVLALVPARTGADTVRKVLRLAGCTLLALVVVGPLTLGMLLGGASRPASAPDTIGILESVIVAVLRPFAAEGSLDGLAGLGLLLCAVGMVAVTVVGAVGIWRDPLGRAVALVVGVATVLVAATYVHPLGVVMAPWYGTATRLGAQVAALLPLLLGPGIVLAARRTRERPRGTVVVVAALAAVIGSIVVVESTATATSALNSYSVVTPADRAAFGWLADHVGPDERVLNDDQDGSLWSYDASRGAVMPVFGVRPAGGFVTHPEWDARLHLRETVQDIAVDAKTRQEARDWSVRYVLLGERRFGDADDAMDRAAIASSAGLRLVFAEGDARVYEIVAP